MLYSDHFALFQTFSESSKQRCHSEKMKNPRWANKKPKKTQGHISIHFLTISGKKSTFHGKKPTFPEKNSFLSAKNSGDHVHISPIFGQNKFTTEFLEIRYFQQKTLKYMYFLVKCEKAQEKSRVFQKALEKTKVLRKNPRFDRKTQDLGRKPKG